MNITEVWTAFFADDAKYSLDNALLDLGEKFETIGKWSEGKPGEMHEGTQIILHRKVTSVSKLPSNPMSSTVNDERNSYVLMQSDLGLQIEDVHTGSGFKYADTTRSTLLWEVYQPTADSEKSVLRVSWRFEWLNKPWLTAD